MRLQNLFIISITILCSLLGCSCNIINATNTPFLVWSAPLSSSGLIYGSFVGIFHAPSNGVLFLGSQQGKAVLSMINAENGKTLWQWQDLLSDTEYFAIRYPYVYDNMLIMNNAPKIYTIDLVTGKSQWKLQIPRSIGVKSTGIGNSYFITNDSLKILRINVEIAKTEEIFKLTNNVKDAVSTLEAPVPIIDSQTQDTLLLSAWSYGFYQNSLSATYLLLYNLTQKRIVYNLLQREEVANAQTGFLVPNRLPIIVNNKIFLGIGKSFQCNDVMTGKLLWRKTDFQGNFFESGVTVIGDKVFCTDTEGDLFCLNALNGAVIWKTTTTLGGLANNLLYLNGVLYFASDGYLYATDASTGARIWRITSPDNESSNGQSFFKGNVTTDGKNIFVSTYLNLYCYKAAR